MGASEKNSARAIIASKELKKGKSSILLFRFDRIECVRSANGQRTPADTALPAPSVSRKPAMKSLAPHFLPLLFATRQSPASESAPAKVSRSPKRPWKMRIG